MKPPFYITYIKDIQEIIFMWVNNLLITDSEIPVSHLCREIISFLTYQNILRWIHDTYMYIIHVHTCVLFLHELNISHPILIMVNQSCFWLDTLTVTSFSYLQTPLLVIDIYRLDFISCKSIQVYRWCIRAGSNADVHEETAGRPATSHICYS